MDPLFVFLIALVFLLLLFLALLIRRSSSLEQRLESLQLAKSSQSVRYGKLTEQWIPLAKEFPYNAEDFRFIGSPIDGVVFDSDEVVLCEFKAAGSQLSEKQRRIKELVENGKVKWYEFRAR